MHQRLGIVHTCTLGCVQQDAFVGGRSVFLSSCTHDLSLECRVLPWNNLLVLVSYLTSWIIIYR